jgi:DNA-binding NtrC family response regulator
MSAGATKTGSTEGLTGSAASLEPIIVEATDGPARGARAELKAGTLSVGSERGNDLVLADKSVSRRHATVELLAGAVKIRDLASRNGTFYLGARIEHARVPIGGAIRVGRTTVRFTPKEAPLTPNARGELHGLIGRSPVMGRLFALLERVGPADGTVLLQGESGSGKEAVAHCLHALSPRAKEPLVVFECAAASSALMSTQLFGHVRGAFTGADRSRMGAVEAAGRGTLILDEVGALQPDLQPHLLRLLENGEFHRVGEAGTRKATMRIIATTQRNLREAAKNGAFREDLYFRLARTEVFVPPLRERTEDIPFLAAQFASEATGHDVPLGAATLAALQCDSWPGNVRELKNAVQRVIALGTRTHQPLEPPAGSPKPSFNELRDRLLFEFERDYLVALLERHGTNISAAAREAGLARSQFYRLLGKHGLSGKQAP